MATKVRAEQIQEDTLEDKDRDTKIYVEKNSDEDKIRFDTAGSERGVLDESEFLLTVPLHITGANGTAEGLRIGKADGEYRQIVFENDGVDSANIHLSNGENLVIMNETAGRDIQFWVDAADALAGDIQALTIKESGKVGVGVTDPTANLEVDGSIKATGLITAKQIHFTTHKYTNTSGSDLKLVRFSSAGSDGTGGDQVNNKFIAPANGKLVKIKFRSTGTPGNTELALMKITDGTENFGNPGSPSSDVIINASSANTAYTGNFSNNNSFNAGDVLGIRVNPTNNHGNVDLTAVWEFDWNT